MLLRISTQRFRRWYRSGLQDWLAFTEYVLARGLVLRALPTLNHSSLPVLTSLSSSKKLRPELAVKQSAQGYTATRWDLTQALAFQSPCLQTFCLPALICRPVCPRAGQFKSQHRLALHCCECACWPDLSSSLVRGREISVPL